MLPWEIPANHPSEGTTPRMLFNRSRIRTLCSSSLKGLIKTAATPMSAASTVWSAVMLPVSRTTRESSENIFNSDTRAFHPSSCSAVSITIMTECCRMLSQSLRI